MPKVRANNITMNYEQQGSGEPLLLLPFLSADYACYAFQVAEYSKYFTCISLDLRGTGETDKPEGAYSTEDLADDAAAFLHVIGVRKAHIAGLSLGGGIGLWLAAKYPEKVLSLSVHSGWPKTDLFVKAVIEGFQVMAKALQSVPEMTIRAIFPWCFYARAIRCQAGVYSVLGRLRSEPPRTSPELERIIAPTQITFGCTDQITSTRFADPLVRKIRNSELLVFEGCAHAPIYEKVEEFNQRTLQFLRKHTGSAEPLAEHP